MYISQQVGERLVKVCSVFQKVRLVKEGDFVDFRGKAIW